MTYKIGDVIEDPKEAWKALADDGFIEGSFGSIHSIVGEGLRFKYLADQKPMWETTYNIGQGPWKVVADPDAPAKPERRQLTLLETLKKKERLEIIVPYREKPVELQQMTNWLMSEVAFLYTAHAQGWPIYEVEEQDPVRAAETSRLGHS